MKKTKNVNRGNNIRVENTSTTLSKDLNLKITTNVHSKIKIPTKRQRIFTELKKKTNSILILTKNMLKTLRVGDFNQCMQERNG